MQSENPDQSMQSDDLKPSAAATLAPEQDPTIGEKHIALASEVKLFTNNNNDRYKTAINNNNNNNDNNDQLPSTKQEETSAITVASIIGEFGPYQLSLTLLAFIRYICVAMMTNTGPLIAPSLEFRCQVPGSLVPDLSKNASTPLDDYLLNRCSFELRNGSHYGCNSWVYNTSETGVTLTDSFDLVCDRDWLRSAFQSIISIGVVIASIIWGSFSDRNGRNCTIRVCFIGSLVSGIVSYAAKNYTVYTISRSICSFSDLGLVVSLTTIVVETLGNKFRGAVCIIVYTGWAFGVMVMPWVTDYFRNFRHLMLFTVCCHLITLPWLMTVSESVRWLLVNGEIEAAGEELKRINKWNRKSDKSSIDEADRKFNLLKIKFILISERRKQATMMANLEAAESGRISNFFSSITSGLTMVGQLFQSRELAVTTITLVWTTFNSELLYMLFIMINSDIGNDVKLNYAIGGIMETLATLMSIVIISRVTRRSSLSISLVLISGTCFVLALTHHLPGVSIWVLNLTKLAISTLSSLIYVTTTEAFPTNLRQTGFGICGTIGSLGAVIAPFVRTELTDLIGMTNVLLIIMILPLTAACLIPFLLRETKGVELSDNVDDIEEEIHRSRAPSLTAARSQSNGLADHKL